jgi:tetratricopeptide (TPR) repeat protein
MRLVLGVLIACTISCGRGEDPAAVQAGALPEVSLPDLSSAADSVQQQVQDGYRALQAARDRGAPSAELAEAYGTLGKLLTAAEYFDAADASFSNARTLAPADMRWPYYLGHVARYRNDPSRAVTFFGEALARAPEHAPSLVWLAEVHLGEGRPDMAEPLLTEALSLDATNGAALSGLGRVALARGNYREAATRLEQALAIGPHATRLHYPLALAYRGLADQAKADEHLQLRGEVDLVPVDPLLDEVARLLQNAAAFETRAAQAIEAREWADAVTLLRQAIDLAPENAFSRLNLGTALYMEDDADGALEQYRAAVRLQPGLARAHLGIGVIVESEGLDREAIDAFTAAVEHDPAYVEARFSLANALRRTGRVRDALAQYDEVIRLDPALSPASFGYAMGLVRLGRYAEARDRLERALTEFPDQPGFVHALARLLAAAPDDRVRDGSRALVLVERLLAGQRTLALAETMAMTLAEIGRFDEAVQWQRESRDFARREGMLDVVSRLEENLRRYESGQPCRTPWAEDDPVHRPVPSAR